MPWNRIPGTLGRYFNDAAQSLSNGPPPPGAVHVFLDLWGVLLDSDKMQREYGRRLARYMRERFGGEEGQWVDAHNAEWSQYVRTADSMDWSHHPWAETVEGLDAGFAVGILKRMGVAWRPSDPAAFSRELDLQVMPSINARFPDSRAAVDRLRAAGHKVFVATQASESNARGALQGAQLLTAIDGLFTGSSQNSQKAQRGYWDRILSALAVPGAECVLVDDRVDYLAAATSEGFLGLLLDREGIYMSEAMPSFVRAVLRNLAGLPHFVDVLALGRDR